MQKAPNITQKETVDLLNKCWMTHDGMWFFHCLQEFGIEVANKLNKSAIKSLSSIEIKRVRNTLDCIQPIEDYDEFKSFFDEAAQLMIPEFMNVRFTYPEQNKMAWEFNQNKCFAYAGIKRLGVIERYDCGVLYRIKCWLDALGITHRFIPGIGKCHMHVNGSCSGEIQLFLCSEQE
ncbi:MAG: hypothetical protein HUN04_24535 [Desulfobacter sp.]|nr:MAG: hypothetical protein HUN04_24535 [Desulfobacter sp.]